MSKEEIIDLIQEIEPDKEGHGYIDCSDITDYSDHGQYKRIVAAINQSLEMHNKNEELTKKLEDVEKQAKESLLQVETLTNEKEKQKQITFSFMESLCKFLKALDLKAPLRIGDYIFERRNDCVMYKFEPVEPVEPIKLEVLITENSGKSVACPLCNKELGKYPALSRKDNKTEICAACGMLEALEDFHKANKDKKE